MTPALFVLCFIVAIFFSTVSNNTVLPYRLRLFVFAFACAIALLSIGFAIQGVLHVK